MQVGGLRIVFASILLFVLGFKSLKTLSKTDWKWVAIAGLCSSFFPPFFFAMAQTEISSVYYIGRIGTFWSGVKRKAGARCANRSFWYGCVDCSRNGE